MKVKSITALSTKGDGMVFQVRPEKGSDLYACNPTRKSACKPGTQMNHSANKRLVKSLDEVKELVDSGDYYAALYPVDGGGPRSLRNRNLIFSIE